MPLDVVNLGAGFGGLELSTVLSEEAPAALVAEKVDFGSTRRARWSAT